MPEENYKLIETYESLEHYCVQIQEHSSWIGFDTEFIGEKRYIPLLCLVQVSSEIGNFIIDPIAISNLKPLHILLEDASILKITHAGENDYQLFYKLFKVLPKNVVDVQIAVGFLGDGYPSSFQRIVQKYTNVKLAKSQTVSNWNERPIRDKQIKYALNDVIYLKNIWEQLERKLKHKNRLEWLLEECSKFCLEENYNQDLLKDILTNKIMSSLKEQEQLFYIRLHLWREKEAEKNNYSREKVLTSKSIPIIIKTIHAGKKSLISDRRIPDYIIKKNWDTLNELYQKPATEEEKNLLKKIIAQPSISEKHNIIMDLLNQVFKFICTQHKVAGTLLMSRSDFNRMKYEPDFIPEYLKSGWRNEVLGKDLVLWLEQREKLKINFSENEIKIGFKN